MSATSGGRTRRTRMWCRPGSSTPASRRSARRQVCRPIALRSNSHDNPLRWQTAPRTPSPSWENHATNRCASLVSWPHLFMAPMSHDFAPELRRQACSEVPIVGSRGDTDLACVGELDGIADEVEEHLSEPLLIAHANRQLLGNIGLKREFLGLCQRLGGCSHRLYYGRDGI